MNVNDCVEKSIKITTDVFLNNDTTLYFDSMVDNVIWHGVTIGQKIKGLDTLRKAWKEIANSLVYSLGDIEAEYIQTSSTSCEVMLLYSVTIHYPNGDTLPVFERLQFSWADTVQIDEQKHKKRIPKIFMVHISNPTEYHPDDFLFPNHGNEVYIHSEKPFQEPRISLRGMDNVYYVIAMSSVIWMESTPEQHCLLHLRERTIKVKTTLTEIEKKTKGFLVRIHSGYIVNPLDVVSVCRFKVTLSDGVVLPIPEKKYTAIKKKLLEENPNPQSSLGK